jgi:hypothetical protein
VVHEVLAASRSCFTWDYERSRPALAKLYERAKNSQWNVSTDIDWGIDVDPWRIARDPTNPMRALLEEHRHEPPFDKLSREQWYDLGAAHQAWVLSQFKHGEQGALLCAAKIVHCVPWIDAKYYAATQVQDEARHVEAYSRYLAEKMAYEFPVNVHLRSLLDDVLSHSEWDMTYLGMQIMIEGLALAAFGSQYHTTPDPLLRQLTRLVIADEARHVAFGVLSLEELYRDLSASELRVRQEFCYEAALRMRDRFLAQELWEWYGLPVDECCDLMTHSPAEQRFRRLLFSNVVPNLRRLGLLDADDGWLRQRFAELGVLELEHLDDSATEHQRLVDARAT